MRVWVRGAVRYCIKGAGTGAVCGKYYFMGAVAVAGCVFNIK